MTVIMKNIFLTIALLLINISFLNSQPVFMWTEPGGGVNGNVNVITVFNDKIVVAGGFTIAGTDSVKNIAMWNGSTWEILGEGLNDSVYALTVFNGELVAGGSFTASGSTSLNHIARWNGTSWQPFGSGLDGGEVKALIVHNDTLYAGGSFDSPANIAQWNGSAWQPVGGGVDNQVHAFTIYNGNLVAGGRFEIAGGNPAMRVASWNGSSWSGFNSDFNERVFALAVYNNELIVGGRFENSSYPYIARLSGGMWTSVGGGLEDRVFALTVYNNELVAAGQFKFAGSSNLMVNRIASWDGNTWKSLSTGMNNKVKALAVNESDLIAGGEFTTAGGLISKYVSIWRDVTSYSASGTVLYNISQNPVTNGKVYALRIDYYTREVIVIDSADINTNGAYTINNIPANTEALIITRANDDLDYVPTYFPSTLFWENAQTINLSGNIENVNIEAIKIENDNNPGSIGGKTILNYLPAGYLTGAGLPFKSDAIIYFKIGNEFKGFGISNNFENYIATSLPQGSYDIIVNRIGYETVNGNAVLNYGSGFHLDSVNFILDTAKLVNIVKIENVIPENFTLYQNFPNPFNPSTVIRYSLRVNGIVTLKVFDLLGREVTTLVNEKQNPGTYSVEFNASSLSSGVYFYQLNAAGFTDAKRMLLIK
jgi:hypothetical protein